MTPVTPRGFAREPVSVRAPATCANLGPGFDSFGLALAWYDVATATATSKGLNIDVVGEGAGTVPLDETHLVVRALRATLDVLQVAQPGLRLVCGNTVPQGRGLGSSAAAIVTGIRLAQELVVDAALQPNQDLELAAALEGHADNVAACLLGGLTIAWTNARTRAVRLRVHHEVVPLLFVPATGLSTALARDLLPATVPHADASRNAGRAGLLAAALTTYPELLLAATEDRLHQEFRRGAMPQTLALVDRLRDAGIPAVVSGAGPSVLVLATRDGPVRAERWSPAGWRQFSVPVDLTGACRDDGAAGARE